MEDSTNNNSIYKRSNLKSSVNMDYSENEIDKIFLSKSQVAPDDIKIENLKLCVEKINELFKSSSSSSFFDLKSTDGPLGHRGNMNGPLTRICGDIEDISLKYKIYEIQLKQLSNDLEIIQERNSKIELKMNFEKEVLDKLTQLTNILNTDAIKIEILENGHFDVMEDLVKMEESLSLIYNLNNMNRNINNSSKSSMDCNGSIFTKFNKVKLIKEISQKILTTKKNFYKRFSVFLNSLLLKFDGKGGELRVHKELYESIKKYKFIFILSKANSSENFSNKNVEDNKDSPYYFNQIFQSYISYASNLYMREFKNHLKSIINLVNDLSKLSLSIEILFKSFESLCKVELNFLKNLTKNERDLALGMSLIFGEVSDLILEYLEQMFKKSKIITILSIAQHFMIPSNKVVDNSAEINDMGKNVDEILNGSTFNHFNLRLHEKLKVFKKLFIKEDKNLINIISTEDLKNLEIINFILKQNESLGIGDIKCELIKRMIKNYRRILNKKVFVQEVGNKDNEENDKAPVKQIIFINQLFFSIEIPNEMGNGKFLKHQENFLTFLIFLKQRLSEELVRYIFKEKDIKEQILKVFKMIRFIKSTDSTNLPDSKSSPNSHNYFLKGSDEKIVDILKISIFECLENNVKEKKEIKEFIDSIGRGN